MAHGQNTGEGIAIFRPLIYPELLTVRASGRMDTTTMDWVYISTESQLQ